GKVSQVGSDADLDAFGAKGESHRIGRVVRNSKWLHRNVADLEAVAGFELLQLLKLRTLARGIAHGSRPNLVRGAGQKDRNLQLPGKHGQSVDVIRMLVGDKNRGERVRIFAQRLHALEGLTAGNSGVNQNLRARAG